MQRQGQAQANGSSQDQLALAEELEAMARQLERLSRTQPNPQLQQSIQQMRNAAQAMRRAAANATAGGTGGVGQARQAAQDLSEARRLLDQGRARQFSERSSAVYAAPNWWRRNRLPSGRKCRRWMKNGAQS